MSIFIVLKNDWQDKVKIRENQFVNAFSDIRFVISFFTELIDQEQINNYYPFATIIEPMSTDDLVLLTKNNNNFHYFFINAKEDNNDFKVHRFNGYTYPREYNLLLNAIEKITGIDY